MCLCKTILNRKAHSYFQSQSQNLNNSEKEKILFPIQQYFFWDIIFKDGSTDFIKSLGTYYEEIEQRTLEVSYTVPGGSRRGWISKLIAVTLLLLCVEVLLVLATSLFFNDFTVSAIYGAFQGAVFFLVFAMWAGALVKNELVAVLLTLCVGYFNMTSTSSRWSPLFNPIEVIGVGTGELFAWSIQNHVGFAILILGIAFLAFSRADRSEVMLAD